MISVLTRSELERLPALLRGMHVDRRRVFVDRLGWELPVIDEVLEIDRFDTPDAVYLIAHDPAMETHLGSLRLLPTLQPHLLSDVFPQMCEGGPMRGASIWEISRYCTSPDIVDARAVRSRLLLAVGEFAELAGVTHYTAMTHLAFLSQVLAIGWDCEPLGLPAQDRSGTVGALVIRMTEETLPLLRARSGQTEPVLSILSRSAA